MSEILEEISTAVIEGDLDEIEDLTEDALDDDLTAEEILNKGLMPGMDYVGVEFKAGNMFVPEVLRSARTMQVAMDILNPLLAESGVQMVGKVLLGTVKGDLHDIGKNLVGMMCEGAGFEVRDIGKDIAPEGFVEAVKEYRAGRGGHVGPADNDHAGYGEHHQDSGRGRPARQGQDHDRRRARDPGLCRPDWRRRLRLERS